MTKVPILVMKHQYDGTEKIAAIEAGADEFIRWPDTIEESVASGRALIRRYIEPNQPDSDPPNIFSKGEVFNSVDYHKVFIRTVEIPLPRREFDLFYLLVSNPDRVFKPELIDYLDYYNNRRIKAKLKGLPPAIHRQQALGAA